MDRTFNPNLDMDSFYKLRDDLNSCEEDICKFIAKHNQLFTFDIKPNEVALVYFVSTEASEEYIAKALNGFNGESFNIETGDKKDCSYDNWLRCLGVFTDLSDLLILKCVKEDAKEIIKKLASDEFLDVDGEELFSLLSVHSADAFNAIIPWSIECTEENIGKLLNI